jgi:CrcB protein
MMLFNIALVAVGGFAGAISRYKLSAFISSRFPSAIPYGTLTINLLGSFLLGWMAGHHWPGDWTLLFGTGFMGAFTTFSTFKLESLKLWQQRAWGPLILYIGFSYTLGIILAFLGFYW